MNIVEKKTEPIVANKDFFVVADKMTEEMQEVCGKIAELGFSVREISAEMSDLPFEEGKPLHIAIKLTPYTDTAALRSVLQNSLETNSFLYFFGDCETLLPLQPPLLFKIPSAHFINEPFDLDYFAGIIEYNLREKKRILVVDDDPILLRSIKIWLKDDFDVSLLTSGNAALDFLAREKADLILLDYRMPEMDGPDVLKKLRQIDDTARIPVIFLTAKADKDSVMTAMQMKPEGYILKNRKPEEIRNEVIHFFKKRVIKA